MALTSRSAPASRRLVDAHLDAELDVLADHQRLDVQVAARQVAQVEDRLRHHAGDDAAVELRRASGRAWPAAGSARRRIRRPCGWPRWRCATGRSSPRRRGPRTACWCCPVRSPAASGGLPEEDVAGGDAAAASPSASRRRSAPSASRPSATPSTVSCAQPRDAGPSEAAGARGPGRRAIGCEAQRPPRRAARRSKALGQRSPAASIGGRLGDAGRQVRGEAGGRTLGVRSARGPGSRRCRPPATGRRRHGAPDSTRMPDDLARPRAARRWAI